MVFQINNQGTFVDLTQYMEFSSFDGSKDMISGPNADRAMNKRHILDDLGYEISFGFTTRWLDNATARALEELMSARPFTIRSDYYESSPTNYEMICDNIKKVVVNSGPSEMVKLSGVFVEE